MVERPKLGIVTVTFNSASVIEGFLRSLAAQTHHDFIIVVVDNASSDDTRARVASARVPRLRFIPNHENRGVAGGNNQGIRECLSLGCDSILLLNNDTEFGPSFLETLMVESHTLRCDLLAPKIVTFDDPNVIWFAGGYFSRWRAHASLHHGRLERDRGQHDKVRSIEYAPTCCLLVARGVFDRIGLMDETYFVYYEDADFCLRAIRAGLTMLYSPRALLLHKEGSLTGGSQSPFASRFGTRNKIYFLRKHLGPQWVFWAALYQGYLLARLLALRDSLATFKLRHRALWEGARLPLSQQRSVG